MNQPTQNTRAALRAYRDGSGRREPWWGGPPAVLFTAQVIACGCVTAAAVTFFDTIYTGDKTTGEILGGIVAVMVLAAIGAALIASWAYQAGRDSHRREVCRELTRILAIGPEFTDTPEIEAVNIVERDGSLAAIDLRVRTRMTHDAPVAYAGRWDQGPTPESEADAVANDRR